jgi:hypothetical protein
VFLLGEWESRDLHAEAFDATYAWSWYEALHNIARGKADTGALFSYYAWNECFYPAGAQRMTFVSNHDKNSWEGTQFEQFGDALEAAIVLSVVGEGMPLLYNGQEAGNPKRLQFFERDPIDWRPHRIGDLYEKLFALKHANSALGNAPWGAPMVQVTNSAPKVVFSFVRENQHDKVFAVLNFSAEPQNVTFHDGPFAGSYVNFFSGDPVTFAESATLEIDPWGYRVFLRPAE